MSMKSFLCAAIVGVLLLPAIGCGGGNTGTVTGVVKIDGEPAPGLEVTFTPAGHIAGVALGTSQEGGHFVLIQGRGNKRIPIGKYRVSVTGSPDAKSNKLARLIPKAIRSSNDTPITKEVAAGKNEIEINVTTN